MAKQFPHPFSDGDALPVDLQCLIDQVSQPGPSIDYFRTQQLDMLQHVISPS